MLRNWCLAGLVGSCVLGGAVVGVETSPAVAPGARAELKDATGRTVGRAELVAHDQGVVLTVRLEAAAPVGQHALHIHEVGTCSPPTFESAGGHFNPDRAEHGVLNDSGPHAGDLPNLHIVAGGSTVELFVPGVTLHRGSESPALLDDDGAALVLHAGVDDYRTDPAGAAGDRVACGVIRSS